MTGPTRLSRAGVKVIRVAIRLPTALGAGSYALRVCTSSSASLAERSRRNDCRGLGKLVISRSTAPSPTPTPPLPTVPSNPIAFTKDSVLTLTDPQSSYWVYVPDPYDSTHQTPTELFVWLHGCGGEGAGDIYTISPSTSERYISLSVGGREDAC